MDYESLPLTPYPSQAQGGIKKNTFRRAAAAHSVDPIIRANLFDLRSLDRLSLLRLAAMQGGER
jgi:hypothetical protein